MTRYLNYIFTGIRVRTFIKGYYNFIKNFFVNQKVTVAYRITITVL